MSRLFYLFGEGFRGIFKHGFMSFATITIITACLIIMGSVSLLSINIDALIADLEDQNEVVAFVDENYTDEQAQALQPTISNTDNIASIEYVSREDAMNEFMSNYSADLMEGIDASVFRNRYVVQLTDIAKMAETKTALENITGIVKVNAHIDYAESFISIRNIVSVVSLVLIAILVFVSFFIMSNTIKLATLSRKEEIGIMKMVGASNAFIRMPFVIEGLILGLFGSMLAFFAEWGIYNFMAQKIEESASGLIDVIPFSEVMMPVLVAFFAVGILVGCFGGVNAIRNYLKV